MSDEHAEIDPALTTLTSAWRAMAGHPCDDHRHAIEIRLAGLREVLGAHLEHEETVVLPLVQRVMTEDEFAGVEREIQKGYRLRDTPFMIGWVVDGLPPEALERFFAFGGSPFKLPSTVRATVARRKPSVRNGSSDSAAYIWPSRTVTTAIPANASPSPHRRHRACSVTATGCQWEGTGVESEIELVADSHGVAVIGEPGAVDLFLQAQGLEARDLHLPRIRQAFAAGGAVAAASSEIAANSGRWVKLTEDSAKKLKHSQLMKGSTNESVRAVVTEKGKVKGILEISKGTIGRNPAALAGVAGIMAQVAMQQAMDEITDYLERIETKVDDVLRAQTDQVLARMIGVGLVIDESMTLRDSRGRVDEVTWSKVQTAPTTIAETQAYALRQLDHLADKLEKQGSIAEVMKSAAEAEAKTQEWLAVLARTFQLQDAVAVLELDRVLDASPAELDGHRCGLETAREQRLAAIAGTTDRLVGRMRDAAARANDRVLFNPFQSPSVVASSNHVFGAVVDLNATLGITSEQQSHEARRWAMAATDMRDKALETGAGGVGAAKRLGSASFGRARSVGGKVSSNLVDKARRGPSGSSDEEP
jgi:hypothetical protein